MKRRRPGTITFKDARGRTIESVEYEESADWQALLITFSDGRALTFEINSHVDVRASSLEKRKGDLKLIRNYGRISGDGCKEP